MFAYRGQYIECIMGIKWRNLLLFLLQDTTDDVGLLYTYRIQGRFTPWTMKPDHGRWHFSLALAKQTAAGTDSSYVCLSRPVHGIQNGNSMMEFVVVVVGYYRCCGVIIYVSYSRPVYTMDHEVGPRKMPFLSMVPAKQAAAEMDSSYVRLSRPILGIQHGNSVAEFFYCCCIL